ncbi:hypothetical protein D3C80_2219530 [compost metagenome]
MSVERNAVHTLAVFVGGQNAGHLSAVANAVMGAGTIFYKVKTGVADPALKRWQFGVQA